MFRKLITKLVRFAANDTILHPRVRVIDSNGVNLGILDRAIAMSLARDRRADLVLVRTHPEPLCVIGRKEKVESDAERAQDSSDSAHSFVMDPCNKVKRIQFSPNVDVKDFERKIDMLRQFLMMRHRCEIVLSEPGPDILGRVFSEVRDVGSPTEEIDFATCTRVKIWPALPGNSVFSANQFNIVDKSDSATKNRGPKFKRSPQALDPSLRSAKSTRVKIDE